MISIRPIVTKRIVTPIKHIKTNNFIIVKRKSVLTDANNIATAAHYTAKGIILFTMFYCSLNYMYYRRINKEIEKHNKDK